MSRIVQLAASVIVVLNWSRAESVDWKAVGQDAMRVVSEKAVQSAWLKFKRQAGVGGVDGRVSVRMIG